MIRRRFVTTHRNFLVVLVRSGQKRLKKLASTTEKNIHTIFDFVAKFTLLKGISLKLGFTVFI